MKILNIIYRSSIFSFLSFAFSGLILVHLFGFEAVASEEAGEWRPIYDKVMLVVNFLIIAFVVYKFGKEPLVNFLKQQREEVAGEIESLEKAKKDADLKVEETRLIIEKGDEKLEKLKKRITEQGEKEKEKIIENSREQSRIMIKAAKKRIDTWMLQAQKQYKSELIDMAVAAAINKLPGVITEDDINALNENYLESMKS